MRVFYSPAYIAAADDFDTTRKAGWVAERLSTAPTGDIRLCVPEPLGEVQLCALHDARYVSAVRTGTPRNLAESQELDWDEHIWTMACAQNGGMLAAMRAARSDGVSGTLSSGLHHAKRERGDGFCTFNGLALAARAALDEGAGAVLILDLDAHCGGGTYALVAGEPRIWQLDVATAYYDWYRPIGHHTLDVLDHGGDYLPIIRARLAGLDTRAPHFDLCLYNAGVDPCEECRVGGMAGITRAVLAERDALVFDWLRARSISVAFALAGGYTGPQLDVQDLVDLHCQTIAAAARLAAPEYVGG